MAKRTKEKLRSDRIIRDYLDELGKLIVAETMDREESRVRTQNLQLSQNFRVKPDNVLTLTQAWYGAQLIPNNLKNVVEEYTPEYGKIIQKTLTEMLLKDFTKNDSKQNKL